MTNWTQRIDAWRAFASVKSFPAAKDESVKSARVEIIGVPDTLVDFWTCTNGLVAGSFKILPIESPAEIKRTWDSFQRANDPRRTRFLGGSEELFEKFIVFADIGAGRAALLDRVDGSIWYEEEEQLVQTDLSLEEFVETMLREVSGV